MKILVTDDSKMARKMLIKTLDEFIQEDHEIFQAANGQECLDVYKEKTPDLVFLDLTMPVMDGFEALKQVKAYDQNAQVVIVSADIQKGSLHRVLSDGAINFVKKPIDNSKMKLIFDKLSF